MSSTVELDDIFHVTDNPLAERARAASTSKTRSRTVTSTRRGMRSSIVSSIADTSAIKMSLPWVVLALLVVAFNCYLSLMAAELVPITFLVDFVKEDTEKAQKAEARLMIRYTCSVTIYLVQLIYAFIFLHNPYKAVGVLQLAALVFGIASRALLAKIPEGAGSHAQYSYGHLYIVDCAWVLTLYFVSFKCSQTIKSKFTPDQAAQVSPLFTSVCPLFTCVCPLFTRVCPLFTRVCPLFTRVCPLFTRVCPLFTRVRPLFTRVCPLFTRVCPLFTRVCPLFTHMLADWMPLLTHTCV